MHFKIISYFTTAAGASPGTAAAAVSGDSLTIENNQGKDSPEIVAFWAKNQATGFHSLAWPSGPQSAINPFKVGVLLGEIDPKMPLGLKHRVQAQETISATIAGSATAGDVELGCMLVKYPNLPGINGRAVSWGTVMDHYEAMATLEGALTGAAAGYTGSAAINAAAFGDVLHPNRDYAVLGITTTLDCAAICIQGPDTGNARVGCPGDAADNENQQNWFAQMSRGLGNEKCIPVINTGNKTSTFISFLQDENNISPVVTLFLALLEK